MAIAFANLGASVAPDINSTSNTTSYANASWTPPTNGLIVLFVVGFRAAAADTPTVSGNGITWTQIGSSLSFGTSFHRLSLFAANAVGSTAGATTISFGANAQTHCAGSFFHVTGVDLAGGVAAAFVQTPTGTGTGTTGTVNFAAAANVNNRAVVAFVHQANEATTPRTNWVEIDDLAGSADVRGLETQWRNDAFETTATATWTTSSAWGGIGAELKASNSAIQTNLLGFWRMDDGALTTTMRDRSPNALDGAVLNTSTLLLGEKGIWQGGTDGAVNLYSTTLNSLFNPNEQSVFVRCKPNDSTFWTDGLAHRTFHFAFDGVNSTTMRKLPGNNDFVWRRWGSGVSTAVQTAGNTFTDWTTVSYSCSDANDQYKAFQNGAQVGTTQTGLGTWVGALISTEAVIGAFDTTTADEWFGWLQDFIVTFNGVVATDAHHASVHAKLVDNSLQTHDLDNYFGAGNWGWWTLRDTDIDDVSGKAHHGRGINVTPAQAGPGDGMTAMGFDGTTDVVQLWSPSLRDTFDPNNLTLSLWFYADAAVWTDTLQRQLVYLAADTSNLVSIYKRSGASDDVIQFVANFAGTAALVNTVFSGTGWRHVGLTITNNRLTAYVDGIQSGAQQTITTSWAGTLASNLTLAGASTLAGANSWNGRIARLRLYNRALAADEIALLASLNAERLGLPFASRPLRVWEKRR